MANRLNLYSLKQQMEEKIANLEKRILELESASEKKEKVIKTSKQNNKNKEVWDPSRDNMPVNFNKRKNGPVQKRPEGVKFHKKE